jgi:hypothetical protein
LYAILKEVTVELYRYFFLQRGQIFQIEKIDNNVEPKLYFLRDLMKDPVAGRFYLEQLVKSPKPDYQTDFFAVEKILKTKKYRGKTYYLVKYLYYPDKFNQYIPQENLTTGTN